MSRLVLRSSGGGGGGGGSGFTPAAGFNYSGSFVPGGTFTITQASGFGSGPTVAFYDDFSGHADGAAVGLNDPIVGAYSATSNSPKYVAGANVDGSSVINVLTPTLASANAWAAATIDWTSSASPYVYVYRLCRMDGNNVQTSSNQKDIWIMRGVDYDHNIYPGALQSISSNGGETQYNGGSVTSDNPGNDPPNAGYLRRPDVWNYHEFGVKPNTTAAVDALSDYFCTWMNPTDGYYRDTSTGLVHRWHSPGVPAEWDHAFLPGDFQDQNFPDHGIPNPPYASYYYYGALGIQSGANAWKRFLLVNNATFSSGTQFLYARPTSWADGSVTLKLPRNSVSNFTGWHLYFGNGASMTRTGVGS